jgi:hypothetical protein
MAEYVYGEQELLDRGSSWFIHLFGILKVSNKRVMGYFIKRNFKELCIKLFSFSVQLRGNEYPNYLRAAENNSR